MVHRPVLWIHGSVIVVSSLGVVIMKKVAYLLAILMVWGAAFLPPIRAAASVSDMNPRIAIVGEKMEERIACGRYVAATNDDIKTEIGIGWDFMAYDQSTGTITVNMIEYRKNSFDQDNRQVCMQKALENISTSEMSRTNQNKVYNELCALDDATSSLVRQLSDDVSADFAGAYKYIRPFSGPLGVVLGCLTVVIFVVLGLSVVVDTAYLNIPFIADWLGSRVKDGGKPKFVSLEAYKAMQQAESKQGIEYVSQVGLFLKFKSKQYVMMAICLLYLTSGQLFSILAVVIDYFRGVLE